MIYCLILSIWLSAWSADCAFNSVIIQYYAVALSLCWMATTLFFHFALLYLSRFFSVVSLVHSFNSLQCHVTQLNIQYSLHHFPPIVPSTSLALLFSLVREIIFIPSIENNAALILSTTCNKIFLCHANRSTIKRKFVGFVCEWKSIMIGNEYIIYKIYHWISKFFIECINVRFFGLSSSLLNDGSRGSTIAPFAQFRWKHILPQIVRWFGNSIICVQCECIHTTCAYLSGIDIIQIKCEQYFCNGDNNCYEQPNCCHRTKSSVVPSEHIFISQKR